MVNKMSFIISGTTAAPKGINNLILRIILFHMLYYVLSFWMEEMTIELVKGTRKMCVPYFSIVFKFKHSFDSPSLLSKFLNYEFENHPNMSPQLRISFKVRYISY